MYHRICWLCEPLGFEEYRLYTDYTGRARTEICYTPASVSRGVDITLNFLLDRNELIELIKLDGKCNLGSCIASQSPTPHIQSKGFFDIQVNSSCGLIFLLSSSSLMFRVTWSPVVIH